LKNKTLRYLSPTGISTYRKNPEQFYLDYLAPIDRVREPQTQPMAIGSSFDAYVKNYVHEKLFGKGHDPKYAFDNIFEAQVSQEWRDWARLHGMYLFDIYEKSGALADLMLELSQAINIPQFEIEVMGAVHSDRAKQGDPGRAGETGTEREAKTMVRGGVTFLGKPDVFYINKFGSHVILDFKVNGYLSRTPVSPMPGYVRLRRDRKKAGKHDDCRLLMHNGTLINGAGFLEQTNIDWATQLSVYAWLLGCTVGEDFIAAIDQICCAPNGSEFPDIRIAEHRMRVGADFQHDTFTFAQGIWEAAHSDHFFRDLTKTESDMRCGLLTNQLQMSFDTQKDADTFLNMTRPIQRKF